MVVNIERSQSENRLLSDIIIGTCEFEIDCDVIFKGYMSRSLEIKGSEEIIEIKVNVEIS